MEAPRHDFLALDGDHQDARAELGAVKLTDESSEDFISPVADRSPLRSLGSPERKVHSAASSSFGFGFGERYEDIPRPYMSAGLDPPANGSFQTRHRKKNTSVVRKKTANEGGERPRSAGVDEWGDFDTDRLLRDDFKPDSSQSNQTLDPLDGQRSRSRKSRRATPATTSPGINPWEGYLDLPSDRKESSKPDMQVLRQKRIEILNFDLVSQANQPSGRANTPKPLLGRASMEKRVSRPTTSYDSRPTTANSRFGSEIVDTPQNRAIIFARFTQLWSLLPHHRLTEFESPADTKAAFECSTTMVKICKTVGISLPPSAATELSFWSENEVDFDSFCNLVVQGAIQPALHHFNLDNSINEYVSALDTIVQSLVTTAPARKKDKPESSHCPSRVKELSEVHPVFLNWKAEISPRLIPAEEPDPPPTRTLVTAEKVRKTLENSVSQRLLAHQLPSEEARVTHVENIRRKVQLHKSWKPSSSEKGVNSLHKPLSRSSLVSSHEERAASRSAELSAMFENTHSVFPTSTGLISDEALFREGDRPELHVEQLPEEKIGVEDDAVLVCCSCSVRSAVLWCASCFTVTCQKCWQEVHACTVDMSTISSAKQPLLGPTTLAIQKKICGSVRPPVAMIYLPTKQIVSGTLAKGNPIVRNRGTSSATKDEDVPTIVANGILPSLLKSRSDSKLLRRHERQTPVEKATDSSTALMNSLMLGSRSTSSIESATRLHKLVRPKFPLAPVSIDAELLLARRR